jgi:hypothetical protein
LAGDRTGSQSHRHHRPVTRCWTFDVERRKNEFLEFGIAAFLVSMGPGSYFGFSDMQNDAEGGGWFDVSWEYHSQYDTIVTGRPVGEVKISDDGMSFTRAFENGTVWVNAADGSYEIDLSSGR